MSKEQSNLQEITENKKPIHKKWWFWVVVVIVLFSIMEDFSEDSQKQTTLNTEEVIKTSDKKMEEEKEEVLREKIDFTITAEEIYSKHAKCQEEIRWDSEGRVTFSHDLIPKKYEGKIIAITGTVEKAEDVVEILHSSLVQREIDEGRRYYICLADSAGHACVAWVHSPSYQLINNVNKNDRITVAGNANLNSTGLACDIPNLMNSIVVEKH